MTGFFWIVAGCFWNLAETTLGILEGWASLTTNTKNNTMPFHKPLKINEQEWSVKFHHIWSYRRKQFKFKIPKVKYFLYIIIPAPCLINKPEAPEIQFCFRHSSFCNAISTLHLCVMCVRQAMVCVKRGKSCDYLVRALQSAHQTGDLLHHRKVMLQLMELLIEPRRTQDHFTCQSKMKSFIIQNYCASILQNYLTFFTFFTN